MAQCPSTPATGGEGSASMDMEDLHCIVQRAIKEKPRARVGSASSVPWSPSRRCPSAASPSASGAARTILGTARSFSTASSPTRSSATSLRGKQASCDVPGTSGSGSTSLPLEDEQRLANEIVEGLLRIIKHQLAGFSPSSPCLRRTILGKARSFSVASSPIRSSATSLRGKQLSCDVPGTSDSVSTSLPLEGEQRLANEIEEGLLRIIEHKITEFSPSSPCRWRRILGMARSSSATSSPTCWSSTRNRRGQRTSSSHVASTLGSASASLPVDAQALNGSLVELTCGMGELLELPELPHESATRCQHDNHVDESYLQWFCSQNSLCPVTNKTSPHFTSPNQFLLDMIAAGFFEHCPCSPSSAQILSISLAHYEEETEDIQKFSTHSTLTGLTELTHREKEPCNEFVTKWPLDNANALYSEAIGDPVILPSEYVPSSRRRRYLCKWIVLIVVILCFAYLPISAEGYSRYHTVEEADNALRLLETLENLEALFQQIEGNRADEAIVVRSGFSIGWWIATAFALLACLLISASPWLAVPAEQTSADQHSEQRIQIQTSHYPIAVLSTAFFIVAALFCLTRP